MTRKKSGKEYRMNLMRSEVAILLVLMEIRRDETRVRGYDVLIRRFADKLAQIDGKQQRSNLND